MSGLEEKHAQEELNTLLAQAGLEVLSPAELCLFSTYLSLLVRWNKKTNLTAVRDPDEILSRHFLECIACARALPSEVDTLLDLGSGAGLPGIPIAICRPEIAVTLAESQGKKAAFLREAVRALSLGITVHAHRAELLEIEFGCVILRAVDNMSAAVEIAADLVRPSGWLALMTTEAKGADHQEAGGKQFSWGDPILLPGSEQRTLLLARKA